MVLIFRTNLSHLPLMRSFLATSLRWRTNVTVPTEAVDTATTTRVVSPSVSRNPMTQATRSTRSSATMQKIYAQQIRNALVLLEPKASRCSMYNCISKHDMLFVKFGSLFPQGSMVNKKQKTFELPPPWWLVYRDPGLVYGFHPLYNWVGFHPLYISQTIREFIAQVGFPHISPTENSQVKRIPPFRLKGFWRFLGHLIVRRFKSTTWKSLNSKFRTTGIDTVSPGKKL